MEELSLTVAEAYDCLLVSEEGMVHSFVKRFTRDTFMGQILPMKGKRTFKRGE